MYLWQWWVSKFHHITARCKMVSTGQVPSVTGNMQEFWGTVNAMKYEKTSKSHNSFTVANNMSLEWAKYPQNTCLIKQTQSSLKYVFWLHDFLKNKPLHHTGWNSRLSERSGNFWFQQSQLYLRATPFTMVLVCTPWARKVHRAVQRYEGCRWTFKSTKMCNRTLFRAQNLQ